MQVGERRLANVRLAKTDEMSPIRGPDFSGGGRSSRKPIRNPASRGDARGGIHAASGYPQAACDTCWKDLRDKDRAKL
jgi:hypothetical protein